MNKEAAPVIGVILAIAILTPLYVGATAFLLISGSAALCLAFSVANAYRYHIQKEDEKDKHHLFIARLFFVGAIFHAIYPLVVR